MLPGFELMRRRHRRSKTKYGHKDCPELADENMSIEILKPGKKSTTFKNLEWGLGHKLNEFICNILIK